MINNLDVFKTRWWAWWKELQPSERDVGGELKRIDEGLDWTTLAKPGDNGFLLVLYGLVWWGAHVHAPVGEGNIIDWSRAVEDVKWALEKFSSVSRSTARGKKRGNSDDTSKGRLHVQKRRFLLFSF